MGGIGGKRPLASPHFLQFGQDYTGSRDGYVYACFPAASDGRSYWCNADFLLLGRVRKSSLLIRDEWMDPEGGYLWMVSSGSYDDYNLTVQRLDPTLAQSI